MDGEHTHRDYDEQLRTLEKRVDTLEGDVPPMLDEKVDEMKEAIETLGLRTAALESLEKRVAVLEQILRAR